MNNKRRVGRPRKPNYTPTINLTHSKNLVWEILEVKRSLGMPLTIGELVDLANHNLSKYGITVTLGPKKKPSFCKRVLNWFRNLCK